MNNIRTELEVLEFIFNKYERAFLKQAEAADPKTDGFKKSYISIDIYKTAEEIGMNADVLFGYLHYYLENKYGNIEDKKGKLVRLFVLSFEGTSYWFNMVRAAPIIAQLKDEEKKFNAPFKVSKIAIIISIVVLLLQVLQLVLDYLPYCA